MPAVLIYPNGNTTAWVRHFKDVDPTFEIHVWPEIDFTMPFELAITWNHPQGVLESSFNKLPKGAFVINVGRGRHLIEQDLLDALNVGSLSGACLDVFREEPLPGDHPFWRHPKILVTCHVSSITNPKNVARQIVNNYHRLLRGEALIYTADVEQGY